MTINEFNKNAVRSMVAAQRMLMARVDVLLRGTQWSSLGAPVGAAQQMPVERGDVLFRGTTWPS